MKVNGLIIWSGWTTTEIQSKTWSQVNIQRYVPFWAWFPLPDSLHLTSNPTPRVSITSKPSGLWPWACECRSLLTSSTHLSEPLLLVGDRPKRWPLDDPPPPSSVWILCVCNLHLPHTSTFTRIPVFYYPFHKLTSVQRNLPPSRPVLNCPAF